jgi:hypothetical protein
MQTDSGLEDFPISAEDRAAVSENRSIDIGGQPFTVQGDEVVGYFQRAMSLPEIIRLLRITQEVKRLRGRVFLLAQVSGEMGTVSPESRRWIAEWGKRHHIDGLALSGGSAVGRALTLLIVTAVNLLRKAPTALTFVQSEAEARAWVAAQRQRLGG